MLKKFSELKIGDIFVCGDRFIAIFINYQKIFIIKHFNQSVWNNSYFTYFSDYFFNEKIETLCLKK